MTCTPKWSGVGEVLWVEGREGVTPRVPVRAGGWRGARETLSRSWSEGVLSDGAGALREGRKGQVRSPTVGCDPPGRRTNWTNVPETRTDPGGPTSSGSHRKFPSGGLLYGETQGGRGRIPDLLSFLPSPHSPRGTSPARTPLHPDFLPAPTSSPPRPPRPDFLPALTSPPRLPATPTPPPRLSIRRRPPSPTRRVDVLSTKDVCTPRPTSPVLWVPTGPVGKGTATDPSLRGTQVGCRCRPPTQDGRTEGARSVSERQVKERRSFPYLYSGTRRPPRS